MWFDTKDIIKHDIIPVADLHGYVLPHASTEFTGGIISHTLRFRPVKKFNKILIIYYPSSNKPDIDNTYYHEYYVPWKSLETVFGTAIMYKGILGGSTSTLSLDSQTLVVVSADFSHFMPFQKAIEMENKAAHALMFRRVMDNVDYIDAVDDIHSFRMLYKSIPDNWLLQWIGRTRSSGIKAVGYLTFLLRETPLKIDAAKANSMFVTVFSDKMTPRECLGEWFIGTKKWSPSIEKNLIDKVLRLGSTTSRLTGGLQLNVPLTNYTVTYLYKENTTTPFVRGWHGLLHNAFYLPEVFLENTFENGTWIKSINKEWQQSNNGFNISETLKMLDIKSGAGTRRRKSKSKSKKNRKFIKGGNGITLFTSKVAHYTII
uniref:Uncharacterized protein n=1 Tax=viral metagenome TaxID=1070528 RepID=A0A6C0HGJ8_9ZZZZ